MPEPDVLLSKSKLLSYLTCPKRLWLESFRPELAEQDASAIARMEAGTHAGVVARGFCPGGGLLIEGASMAEKIRLTREALRSFPRPLYEAAFMYANVRVMADILLPKSEGWQIIEVKSSTAVKPYHISDTAIQTWVLQGSGLDVRRVEIAVINSGFVYPGNGDYEGLFCLQNVGQKMRELLPLVPEWVAGASAVLASPDAEPDCAPGDQCKKPFLCPFRQYCSPVQEGFFPVEILPRIGKAKAQSLREQGYADIRDIPDAVKLTKTQSVVREAAKAGRLILSEDAASVIDALPYPRFYLDFETIQFVVPEWPGTRPYEHIPFQWSCHIEDAPGGALRHYEFLAKHNANPRHEFAETLVACFTGEKPGPVIVYYESFEKKRLKETAEAAPEFAEQLNAIHDRVFDLLPVARKHYYHPGMRGSWSIKRVLSTIAPELDYGNLEIRHGEMAQTAFLEMLDQEPGSPRQKTLRRELLEYCKRDTLAMWRVARFFAGDRAALGRLYLYGGNEGIKEDARLGFALLSSAYDLGYADDALVADLVKCCLYGWGTEQNFGRASRLVENLHDEIGREDPQAMYLLGLVNHEISYDPESGLEWMRRAAAKGHTEAVVFLKDMGE